MVKILILGGTGMLGSAVGRWFSKQTSRYKVTCTHRDYELARQLYEDKNLIHFDCLEDDLTNLNLSEYDYVLNCIGTIKPFMASNPLAAIKINSVFPWALANNCKEGGVKLIHITTDCVYSGSTGKYTETDEHDALDAYGKSKSLGEPDNCMVLRTSIIGEEVHKNASLVEWVKSQRGNTINGYTNHDWNGITTTQYAKTCDHIISNNMYAEERYHVMSPKSVNKHELVTLLGQKYDLDITVQKFEADIAVDRTLGTVKELCDNLNIPSIKQQIAEM